MKFDTSGQGLDEAQLTTLYNHDSLDWIRIIRTYTQIESYNGYDVLSFYKAFTLPFLIRIVSERSLARELQEKKMLQHLCGFSQQRKPVPSRSTFAHYREKYIKNGTFQKIILQLLVEIAAIGQDYFDFDLPYLTKFEPPLEDQSEQSSRITLFYRKLPANIWFTPLTQVKNYSGKQLILPEFEEINRQVSIQPRPSLADNLQLPAVISLSGEKLVIQSPPWLHKEMHNKDQLHLKNAATYNVACNILVIRRNSGQEEVLLSKRLFGEGVGMYNLPGGKKKDKETVRQCAERELFEETGLRLIKSRVASIDENHIEKTGHSVTSVGVLALEYEGVPKHKENTQNEIWEWFNIRNIDVPLFKYSKQTINAYLENPNPDLDWNDVEEQLILLPFD